jgi:hypothetical protein
MRLPIIVAALLSLGCGGGGAGTPDAAGCELPFVGLQGYPPEIEIVTIEGTIDEVEPPPPITRSHLAAQDARRRRGHRGRGARAQHRSVRGLLREDVRAGVRERHGRRRRQATRALRRGGRLGRPRRENLWRLTAALVSDGDGADEITYASLTLNVLPVCAEPDHVTICECECSPDYQPCGCPP